MKIAVLVSVGRHPVSGTARYSRNDAAALTMALAIAKEQRATLDVLHAGDPSNPALQEYLALGARAGGSARHGGNGDGDAIAALAARLKGYDLVLTGTRAEGAFDSGMLPYRLADALGIALVGSAVDVAVKDGACRSPAVHAEGTAPPRAGVAARARRRASDGECRAALRLRTPARRHDRPGRHARPGRRGKPPMDR